MNTSSLENIYKIMVLYIAGRLLSGSSGLIWGNLINFARN